MSIYREQKIYVRSYITTAVVIYDLTYIFCSRYIDKRDRTYDQMIQAARSGKQNIVEGYTDASTSYEIALKLYNTDKVKSER